MIARHFISFLGEVLSVQTGEPGERFTLKEFNTLIVSFESATIRLSFQMALQRFSRSMAVPAARGLAIQSAFELSDRSK